MGHPLPIALGEQAEGAAGSVGQAPGRELQGEGYAVDPLGDEAPREDVVAGTVQPRPEAGDVVRQLVDLPQQGGGETVPRPHDAAPVQAQRGLRQLLQE